MQINCIYRAWHGPRQGAKTPRVTAEARQAIVQLSHAIKRGQPVSVRVYRADASTAFTAREGDAFDMMHLEIKE